MGLRPETRYAKSGDVHIAYQISGAGPRDLVLASGFVSHPELDWDRPAAAHVFERLGKFARLIRFDKRGTGMSDLVGLTVCSGLARVWEPQVGTSCQPGSRRHAGRVATSLDDVTDIARPTRVAGTRHPRA